MITHSMAVGLPTGIFRRQIRMDLAIKDSFGIDYFTFASERRV